VKENFSLSKIFKKIFKKNDALINLDAVPKRKTAYRNIAKNNMPLIKKQKIRSARRIGFNDLDDYILGKSNKPNEFLKPLKKFEPKISADSDVTRVSKTISKSDSDVARPPLSKTIDGSGDIEAIPDPIQARLSNTTEGSAEILVRKTEIEPKPDSVQARLSKTTEGSEEILEVKPVGSGIDSLPVGRKSLRRDSIPGTVTKNLGIVDEAVSTIDDVKVVKASGDVDSTITLPSVSKSPLDEFKIEVDVFKDKNIGVPYILNRDIDNINDLKKAIKDNLKNVTDAKKFNIDVNKSFPPGKPYIFKQTFIPPSPEAVRALDSLNINMLDDININTAFPSNRINLKIKEDLDTEINKFLTTDSKRKILNEIREELKRTNKPDWTTKFDIDSLEFNEKFMKKEKGKGTFFKDEMPYIYKGTNQNEKMIVDIFNNESLRKIRLSGVGLSDLNISPERLSEISSPSKRVLSSRFSVESKPLSTPSRPVYIK
jgi:hypothetical protein